MEIVGCSKEKCVCFDACTSVKNPQYPPCAQNAMASVPSVSNNTDMDAIALWVDAKKAFVTRGVDISRWFVDNVGRINAVIAQQHHT